MGGKTRDDPKSGCKKINNIGNKKTTATLTRTRSDSLIVPIFDRARMLAIMIRVPILAPSVGWMVVIPISTHRRAPIISTLIGLYLVVSKSPQIPAAYM